MSYDNERKLYLAEGDVLITGETDNTITADTGVQNKISRNAKPENSENEAIRLKADYVEFSNVTRDAEASGNVLLVSGNDSIICDRMKLNLESETGTIYQGTVFIYENHFYIRGSEIKKTGRDTYRADSASLTSCDGENPDWRLSGHDVKVTVDGYGTARDATFWAGKLPALYSPIILFPAKTTRQTGLLTPRMSSSDRKGFEYEQPLYLNISRGSDATLYSDYMSERGIKSALEYRYVLSKENYGTFFLDYLDDSKIDDGTSATSDYAYASTPVRDNSDRYWLRMKNNHTFNNVWNTRLDIDYVSDADYLHEFKEGLTGFNSVKEYFSDTFGRGIDEYDDTTRENSLNINRTWYGASLNIGAKWYDDVLARVSDSDNTTLQKLPSIDFNTVRKEIGNTPFYYDLDSEYRYFYREDTPEFSYQQSSAYPISGHRTDLFPRAYLPLKFGPFHFEPSAGVRQTMWYAESLYTDGITDTTGLSENDSHSSTGFNHREMVDLNFELSTKLSRIFDLNNSLGDKIKHEITPTLEYSYVPYTNQSDLPYFDNIDHIEKENCITWKLSNSLTSRYRRPLKKDNSNIGRADEKEFIYREFAWLEISQSYRLDTEESDTASDSDENKSLSELYLQSDEYRNTIDWLKNEYDSRSERTFKDGKEFSDISAELELSPTYFFSFNSDLKWSPYDNRLTSHDSGVVFRDTRGDSLETWYRYEESEYESLFAGVSTKITDSINIFYTCEHDFESDKNIESHTGLYFSRPCWSMRLSYSDTPEDQAISFIVNLHGIGEFGNR